MNNPILTIPLGINSLTSHTLLQGVILGIVLGQEVLNLEYHKANY